MVQSLNPWWELPEVPGGTHRRPFLSLAQGKFRPLAGLHGDRHTYLPREGSDQTPRARERTVCSERSWVTAGFQAFSSLFFPSFTFYSLLKENFYFFFF